jgi:hypothetical protein
MGPWLINTSAAYSEQVGMNRQFRPMNGERVSL